MPKQPNYTCGECGSSFTSQRKLTSHKQQHKTTKIDKTTKIEKVLKKKSNEQYCPLQGCGYKTYYCNMARHLKEKHKRRFYYAKPDEKVETRTCPLCPPSFTITFKHY